MTERAQRLTAMQNGVVGSLAGMIEMTIQQPWVAVKNAVQQGRPVPRSIPALYRGLGVSLSSIAPVSAIRFAINGRLLRLVSGTDSAPTDQVKVLCSTVSGATAAAITGPAELVMTLQQNNGRTFGATVKAVLETHGVARLLRGYPATAIRDAVWCAGYLALGPLFTREVHRLRPQTFGHYDAATASQKTSASIAGCLVAGLVVVPLTQPVDTVKTVMQGEAMKLPSGRGPSMFATARRIYHEGGVKRFYRGIVARGSRLVGAVFILGQALMRLEELFEDHGLLKFEAVAKYERG
ncbi:Mitochondrial Carrier (MC) protein [Phytophthora megakarya]|uniref:Mitochondrial Carrier (MC) protein n=1 Tax=Phytophthora megakarya TaxID=4795 RepID=A0A225WCY8_9STRA|nr:Mitochondrial Carrier (MC) protein [Phytophthora megakarya]